MFTKGSLSDSRHLIHNYYNIPSAAGSKNEYSQEKGNILSEKRLPNRPFLALLLLLFFCFAFSAFRNDSLRPLGHSGVMNRVQTMKVWFSYRCDEKKERKKKERQQELLSSEVTASR